MVLVGSGYCLKEASVLKASDWCAHGSEFTIHGMDLVCFARMRGAFIGVGPRTNDPEWML